MVYILKNKPQDFSNFRLLLIVSNLKDYQLAHFLSIGAKLFLKKYEDFVFATNTDNQHNFSWFHYIDIKTDTKYYLVENKSKNGYLFSNLKKIDYLLFIKNAISDVNVNILKQKLNKIRGINAIFGYEINVLKNVQLFFDEMELHELEYVIKPKKELTYSQIKRKRK